MTAYASEHITKRGSMALVKPWSHAGVLHVSATVVLALAFFMCYLDAPPSLGQSARSLRFSIVR